MFIEVPSDKQQGLFLQIPRFVNPLRLHSFNSLLPLTFNTLACLFGSDDAPHLVERIHIKRKIEEAALIVGNGRIGIAVERREASDKAPHLLVGSMEDMRTILVYVDIVYAFAMNISTSVLALVNHEATFPTLVHEMGKGGSKKAGAHDEIVVRCFHGFFFRLTSPRAYCPISRKRASCIKARAPT